MQATDVDEVTDAVLVASRALVAVAARSLAAAEEDVTLPQYRALVVLAGRGHQPMAVLAEQLGCSPSTATRMCDRLVRKGLVARAPGRSRREVEVSITAAGRSIVDDASRRRRRDIARILRAVDPGQRVAMMEALRAFGAAAGEVPEQAWSKGWWR